MPRLSNLSRFMIPFLLGCIALTGHAQTGADKFSLIVPYPAGGPSDFSARVIQAELQRVLQKPVVIDNAGGAGGGIGVQKAILAPADGNTALLGSPQELVLTPLAMAAVHHKPEQLKPVALLINVDMVLLTRKDFPASTVDQMVELQRAPGSKPLSFGSAGAGSILHLPSEAFLQKAGISGVHIPYKGGAPVLTDLMGGQIDFAFVPLTGSVAGMIREGKVKALGLASRKPSPILPEVPLMSSSKYVKDFTFGAWTGVFVPKATPNAVVVKLNKALLEVMQIPSIRTAYEQTGASLTPALQGKALDDFYGSEIKRYTAMIKGLNIQPQ